MTLTYLRVASGLRNVRAIGVFALCMWAALPCRAQGGGERRKVYGPSAALSVIVGRPTTHTVALSVLAQQDSQLVVDFGPSAAAATSRTLPVAARAGIPAEIELTAMNANTRYFYTLWQRTQPTAPYQRQTTGTFMTARAPGTTFTFAVQGDSHPERMGKMYDPNLYVQTMLNAVKSAPDLYFMLGDDFSIERLISRNQLDQASVNEVYAHQRSFLDLLARSAALFLVNGNHEQAAKYLLDGTPNNFAVMAGRARTQFYPLPAPDGFYTGDQESVAHVGLLRDYYAFTWGDALFVVIDPYWHSATAVDTEAWIKRSDANGNSRLEPTVPQMAQPPGGGPPDAPPAGGMRPGAGGGRGPGGQGAGGQGGGRGQGQGQGPGQGGGGRNGGMRRGGGNAARPGQQAAQPGPQAQQGTPAPYNGAQAGGRARNRDFWEITLGDTQYRWLYKTLTESKARWKFVFCHHVLGTGRGGVERAGGYEWGGHDQRGQNLFAEKRPGWPLPIHDLMARTGVTIFFQGHDHIYAHQSLDGVVYQSCPNPADGTYQAFNREAYQSGDVFPNSGHVRVTVSPENVVVEYVRSFLPNETEADRINGAVAHRYVIPAAAGVK